MKDYGNWLPVIAGVSVCVLLSGILFYATKVASIEIPPEVEKKAVQLTKDHADAESIFISECGKCHKLPDPAKPESGKPDCIKSLSKKDIGSVQNYIADVRAGKGLYESYCGRCHALIEPGSHTFDYWQKNLCTSDSCMVKRKLNSGEEQQVLLYLSSHARKN